MKKVIPGLCISVAAAAQLFFAPVARAQTPPPAWPPPGAQTPPPAQAAPPPAQWPPPGANTAPPPAQPAPGQPGQQPPPAYGYPPPPAYGYAPPPQLQQPVVNGPIVRLRSNNPRATLQQMQLQWRDICLAPCGVPVDARALYRVGGRTVKPSAPFQVSRPAGEVNVDAHAGSLIKFWVGLGLAAGGMASAGLGALYAAAPATFGPSYDETGTRATGIVYLIVGAVLMAVGIPLWVSNGTSVDVQ